MILLVKSVMEIYVKTLERTELQTKIGKVVLIPFEGYVESEIFKGKISKGAVDRQIIDVNGIKHMSARYMLEGVDSKGEECKIYIENTGDFHIDSPKPFKTIPSFYTDSKSLAPYLHTKNFRAEGHREGEILTIKIFEISENE